MIKPIMFIGVLYISSNFLSTKISGEPVYEFLHWEDASSIAIAVLILLVLSFIYILLCAIDENIKWDMFLSKHKSHWKRKGPRFPERTPGKPLFKKADKKKTN